MKDRFTKLFIAIFTSLSGLTISLSAQHVAPAPVTAAIHAVLANQTPSPVQIPMSRPAVVNFTVLSNYEHAHPPKKVKRFIEQGEDREEKMKFPVKRVSSDAVNLHTPEARRAGGNTVQSVSASPAVLTPGVVDNQTLIPADIGGAAGPMYVMETTNQQFNIYTKNGVLSKTLSIGGFFQGAGGSGFFDPHILYDPANGQFLVCIDGKLANGHGAIFIAISQTNDPNGNWYVSSFDGIGNSTDFLDFPEIGYNANWVVVTANDLLSAGGVIAKIYVLNRAALYSGTPLAGGVSAFTDSSSYNITPAQTIDPNQTTEFIVQDLNGNSGGNGYMNIGTITGPVSSPVYSTGSSLGINMPWSETSVNAPQRGGNLLDDGDTRVGGNVTYSNGSLWFAHTVFLPASGPTHAAVDWWQINPVYPFSIQQFNRIEDTTGAVFYYYPSINVNLNGDALLGYCTSSPAMFASAAYSYHAATDAPGSMEGTYIYQAGVANYYKTYGSGRNRWGDYTCTAIDYYNNSFWNFNAWANYSNLWATVIANVAAGAAPACNVPFNLNAANITASSAALRWNGDPGAVSYNIQYRIAGTSAWTSGTAATATFNLTGLSAFTAYEWEVQTVCAGGNTYFSASSLFCTNAASAPSVNVTQPTCSLTTGTITITSPLGKGYTFSIDGINYTNTTGSFTGVASGAYTITVKNSGGCITPDTAVTINAVPVPPVSVINNCNGTSTLSTTATGSLLWSNGKTTSSITVSSAGVYSVSSTVNGCTSPSGSGTAAPATTPVTPTVTVTNNCGNSVLSTTATGALFWNNGATTSSITVTTSGTFSVSQIVNGCPSASGSGSATPKAPPATPAITVTNNCNAGTTTLSTTGSGTCLWSIGATTNSITVSTAGNYSVTQTVNGCTSLAGSASAAPGTTPATPVITVTNNCGNSILSTTASGNLLWSNDAITSSITVTSAGVYTVTQNINTCTSAPGSGTAAPIAIPATPASITGNSSVFNNTAAVPYTLSPTLFATSYSWTIPAGAAADSLITQGLTIHVTYSANAVSGSLTVKAVNSCGQSAAQSIAILVNANSNNTSTTNVTTCNSFNWNGTNYTASGSYIYQTTNAAGYDSVATLLLTINHSSTSSTAATACDSYTWNGATYTTSGTRIFDAGSTSNSQHCDSVAALFLTISHSSTSSTAVTACDSYTWNGTTYTTSGTHTLDAGSHSNSQGCDSIATLLLTINHSSTSGTSVTACNSYTWLGTIYTVAGTYSHDLGNTNLQPCDSVAWLNLTFSTSACGGGITLANTADQCEVQQGVAANVTFTYVVKNTGSAFCSGTITDDNGTPGNTSDDINICNWGPLAPGASAYCMHVFVISQNHTNVATANGTTTGNVAVSAAATATVTAISCSCNLTYPDNSNLPKSNAVFSESTCLVASDPGPVTCGTTGSVIRLWYTDAHAMTLGIRQVVVTHPDHSTTTTNYSIASTPATVECVNNPQVGLTSAAGTVNGNDPAGRPLWPALFITDLTVHGAKSRFGDWQQGGAGIPPSSVCGTWKGAVKMIDSTQGDPNHIVTIITDNDPQQHNGQNNTWGGIPYPPPGGFGAYQTRDFVAECSWNTNSLGLIAGHVYRAEFMVHDGDQNQSGGDAGESCTILNVPSSACAATELVVSCSADSAACSNGFVNSAAVSVTKGTAPYTYSWSNGATTSSISGVPDGTYSVTVTDATGFKSACSSAVAMQPGTALSSNKQNFNNTAIAAGKYIWFSTHVQVGQQDHVASYPLTIKLMNQTITGAAFNLTVPQGTLVISKTVTQATTVFSGGVWTTTIPYNLGGHYFISGLAYQVPANIAGNLQNVTSSGVFTTTDMNVQIHWAFAAAVYSSFTTAYLSLGVKPCDDQHASVYQNNDNAGAPENYKSYVTGGAFGDGNGGNGPTGNFTGDQNATDCRGASREAAFQPGDNVSLDKSLSMMAYPNPAYDKLTVVFHSGTGAKYALRMVDLQGRMVMNQENNTVLRGDNTTEINISNFPEGIYILTATDIEGAKELKIVVNHN